MSDEAHSNNILENDEFNKNTHVIKFKLGQNNQNEQIKHDVLNKEHENNVEQWR